jgi:hypothetical protein
LLISEEVKHNRFQAVMLVLPRESRVLKICRCPPLARGVEVDPSLDEPRE